MNLFGDSDYLEKLSLKGDPLERLEKAMIVVNIFNEIVAYFF